MSAHAAIRSLQRRLARDGSPGDLDFAGSPYRLKSWILFLLEGSASSGIAPVAQDRLHVLLFFGAVLTPVYGLNTPVPMILKYEEAPFYIEAQRELETLCVQGLLVHAGRSSIRDRGADDTYALTEAGLAVIDQVVKTRWGRSTRNFALDLVSGFAALAPADADAIIQEDAFFRADRLNPRSGKIVTDENDAVRAARWVSDYDDGGMKPNKKESLALYFRYLQARKSAA